MGEEVGAGVHCSSSSGRASTPRLAPASSRGEEKPAGSLQRLCGWVWLAVGHLRSFCSLIGRCKCQWGPADCSYCGFLENHHWEGSHIGSFSDFRH